jgi:hypothetical protein
MSHIIVTGGTGFIGKALSRQLVHRGYEVICLTRHASLAREKGGHRIRFVEWDAKSAAGWASYAEGARAIINLAGENIGSERWTREKKTRILNSRLDAGKAVVEAVKSASKKPQVVIQASAVGFYGPRGDEILDESSGPGEGFLVEVTKKWEKSTSEVEDLGVRRVIIRSGLVLDKDGGVFPRFLLPFRFFTGGPSGSGNQWISWIHKQDEIQGILFLIEREDLLGVFNLTSPHPLKNKIFAQTLGSVLGRPSWFPVPAFLLRLMYGEMAVETVLSGQRVLPRRLKESGRTFVFPDAKKAFVDILS